MQGHLTFQKKKDNKVYLCKVQKLGNLGQRVEDRVGIE
mgnify:CR=1 FL=1